MLKRIGLVALVLIILVAMLTFTALNSGTIDLDLAFFAGTSDRDSWLWQLFAAFPTASNWPQSQDR